MNNNSPRKLLSILQFIGLAVPLVGSGQTFQYSGPTSGYFEMLVWDYNPATAARNYGGTWPTFATLNDTVYLDAVSGTCRQAGSITVNPFSAISTFDDSQYDNHGNLISASLTLEVSLASNVLAFDTGVRPVTLLGPGQFQLTSGITLIAPVECSYSWTTGGGTYTGSFSYQIRIQAWPFSNLCTSGLSDSITLSGSNQQTLAEAMPGYLGTVYAANGLNLQLTTGGSDTDTHATWNTAPITAQAVPEPMTLMVCGLGAALASLCLRPRNGWFVPK